MLFYKNQVSGAQVVRQRNGSMTLSKSRVKTEPDWRVIKAGGTVREMPIAVDYDDDET